MGDVVRRMSWSGANPAEAELLLRREWLVTNGLGGYASGTIAGVPTRRYHGLLIAALPAPLGRMVMLRHLREQLRFPDGTVVQIGGEEHAENDLEMPAINSLIEFRLENGLPVWRYQVAETILETRLLLPYMQNTVHITYRVVSGAGPVRLELRPSMHFRGHEAPVNVPFQEPYTLTISGQRYEICAAPELPTLRMLFYGTRDEARSALTVDGGTVRTIFYRAEARRGYDPRDTLWSPGYFSADLLPGQDATLVASTETWETILALHADEALAAARERLRRLLAAAHPLAQTDIAAELVLAADQCLIAEGQGVSAQSRKTCPGAGQRIPMGRQ